MAGDTAELHAKIDDFRNAASFRNLRCDKCELFAYMTFHGLGGRLSREALNALSDQAEVVAVIKPSGIRQRSEPLRSSCQGDYLTVFKPGSIQENRKLLTSGNCDASSPKTGIPTIDAVFHRKSRSSRPGFTLIVRLRIGSRLIDA